MIKPTIGRVVWFTPAAHGDDREDRQQPLAAIVTRVWSDTLVNLTVFDQGGQKLPFNATSVTLLQDDAPAPTLGYYAEWMPFQKGQAAAQEKQAPPAS